MRLLEADIRQGILHREQMVRDASAQYFSISLSTDPTIMSLIVQALKTYGWANAFDSFSHIGELSQTEETFLWFAHESERAGRPSTEAERNHVYRLSSVIAQADLVLLGRHRAQIMGLDGLSAEYRRVIEDRLRLSRLDTDSCWHELEALCEAGKEERYSNRFDLGHARRLVEAIGRTGGSADRVVSLLAQKIENYENNPMKWMEGLAVRLAGEMRLADTVPLIVAKLHDDGDWVNEECVRALTRIGGDTVVEAIAKDFPTAPWHFRLYASAALGKLRSDLDVATCLSLYAREEDGTIKEYLIGAVLDNFASEGIELARPWRSQGHLAIRRRLVAVATLMGIDFPELAEWLEEEHQHVRERKCRQEAMLGGYVPPKARPLLNLGGSPPPTSATIRKKVGRNDPCPCGSGKKYKKCCMD